jgi:photoprotection regulator FRP-like protein
MASSPRPGTLGYAAIRDVKWSPAEKAVARKAFDLALKRELEAVIIEAKKRAGNVQQPSDLWELERYLTERRIQIDRQYEYKYSVLILLFGNLIQQGRLSEQELQGLNQDKLDAIRRYADLEFSAGLKRKQV